MPLLKNQLGLRALDVLVCSTLIWNHPSFRKLLKLEPQPYTDDDDNDEYRDWHDRQPVVDEENWDPVPEMISIE